MQNLVRIFLIASVVIAGAFASASTRYTESQCMPMNPAHPSGGPIDHLPWGSEIPFPWKGIQGVWAAEIDGCTSYFSFNVVKTEGETDRILQVYQVNPANCAILAKGVGYGENRTVTAVMAKMAPKRGSFELKVQAFKESDVRSEQSSRSKEYMAIQNRNVTFLTINPLGRPKDIQSFKLYKVDTDPSQVCQ